MRKWFAILLSVLLIVAGAWVLLREGGVIEQVTEERVEQVLLANGVPVPMSQCMAPRLVDRLSVAQLIKLERLAPDQGEDVLPTSTEDAIARFRRVDDPDALEQLVRVAGGCGIEFGLDLLRR